jgi:hypothetical protein
MSCGRLSSFWKSSTSNTENIEIMSATFKTTIEKDGEDCPVEVEYSYTKGCRGSRDSLGGVRGAGPPLEPDEPPEIEIVSVCAADGTDYEGDLTERERKAITNECFGDVRDRYREAMEAHGGEAD